MNARLVRGEARARVAVSGVFFVTGAATANWAVRIPAVQRQLGLGDARLGIALLGVSAGALVAMPFAGRLATRFGSRPVTRAAAIAFALALMLPALASSFAGLTLSLLTLGVANGLLDVAMNAQAAAVQRRHARPIMASVHAMYSFGGLVGAAVGGQVAAHGIEPARHLIGTGIVTGVLGWAFTLALLPASADAAPERASDRVPMRALLALAIVAFCVLFGEGAMMDWSAVYLQGVGGAGPALAAAGFGSFSLMMAIGRAAGDSLTMRLGAERLVRVGAALATLGTILAIVWPQPWPTVVGFGAVGAGLSSIFPTVLAAAARTRGVAAGASIARVAMCGYAGLLAGPPLIGTVATAITLRGGLALVAVAAAAIVGLASAVRADHGGRAAGRAAEAA